MAGATVHEELVVFVGEGEASAEGEREETAEEIFAVGEENAADREEEDSENTIDGGVSEFAQGSIHEGDSGIESVLVEMSIGDFVFISDVEDFDDGLFDEIGAFVVGIGRVHIGKLKNSETPGRGGGQNN